MPREIDLQIRFNDLDGYGHVNNSVYLSYFEIARTFCYGDIFQHSIENNIWFILTDSYVAYKKFLTQEDAAAIRISISSVKGAIFTFDYVIFDKVKKDASGENVIYATGRTNHVAFDPTTKRVLRCPKSIAELVEKV